METASQNYRNLWPTTETTQLKRFKFSSLQLTIKRTEEMRVIEWKCVPTWSVISLNTVPYLCAVVVTALAIQGVPHSGDGAFVKSPGACERSIQTDTLSQARQFCQSVPLTYRTGGRTKTHEHIISSLHTPTGRKERETWKCISPRQTHKDKNLLLSVQEFIVFKLE